MERVTGQDRMLFGQIEQLFYRLPFGRLRLRVMLDDDQYVTEPTVHIKPRSLVVEEDAKALVVSSVPYGLVKIQREIIRPGHFVPVIVPGHPRRKPFVPLKELIELAT